MSKSKLKDFIVMATVRAHIKLRVKDESLEKAIAIEKGRVLDENDIDDIDNVTVIDINGAFEN